MSFIYIHGNVQKFYVCI